MKNDTPIVSAIMPVYNAEKYIGEAIESILKQTLDDWELIVVDDGSTDGSIEIIKSFHDNRITILRNQQNMGVSKSSNIGLQHSKGRYVTRMDADDISEKTRFEKQVGFLDKHPDYVLCACNVRTTDGSVFFILPEEDQLLKISLLYQNPFVHSSVLVRGNDVRDIAYNEQYNVAEDYELWMNLSCKGKFASLPEILFQYRWHPENASHRAKEVMNDRHKELLLKQLSMIGIQPSEEEFSVHRYLSILKGRETEVGENYLSDLKKWMLKLINTNLEKQVYNSDDFELMMGFRWFLACHFLKKHTKIFPFPSGKNIFLYPYRRLFHLLRKKYKS